MKLYCKHCNTPETKDRCLFMCCNTKMCTNCMEAHFSCNPEHKIIIHDPYKISFNTQKLLSDLDSLKKNISNAIVLYEKKIHKAIMFLTESLQKNQCLLISYIDYIQNLEFQIINLPHSFTLSSSSLLSFIINYDNFTDNNIQKTFDFSIKLNSYKDYFKNSANFFFDLPNFLTIHKVNPSTLESASKKFTQKYETKYQAMQDFRDLVKTSKRCIFLSSQAKHLEEYRNFKHKHELIISKEEIQDKPMAQCLIKLSQIMTDIHYISINSIKNIEITWLFPDITQYPKLKALSVINCPISSKKAFESISSGLKIPKNLIYLAIENCNILSSGLIIILPNLPKTLEVLSLIGNLLGSSGAEMLSKAFINLKQLKRLFLADNDLGMDGINFILKNLDYCKELRALDVSMNNIHIDGIICILDTLVRFFYITYIDISSNSVEDDEALVSAYARCLPRMKFLRNFIVNMNCSIKVRKEIFRFVPGFCSLFLSNEGQKSQVNRNK